MLTLSLPPPPYQDVSRMMAEKLGFSDPEDDSLCFGICECLDGSTIQRPMAPDREVLNVMESWFDKMDARFVFQVKLYTEALVNSKDSKVVQMMFTQVSGYKGVAKGSSAGDTASDDV